MSRNRPEVPLKTGLLETCINTNTAPMYATERSQCIVCTFLMEALGSTAFTLRQYLTL